MVGVPVSELKRIYDELNEIGTDEAIQLAARTKQLARDIKAGKYECEEEILRAEIRELCCVVNDFKLGPIMPCLVDGCNNSRRLCAGRLQRYCYHHESRKFRHGSATPIVACFDCGQDFVWSGPRFRNRPYCDKCIWWITNYPDALPKNLKIIRTITKHGIGVAEYTKMIVSQNYKCAFCYGVETQRGRFSIDHDHNHCPGAYGCRKCVRGLICSSCNHMIGFIENHGMTLDEIAHRLEKYQHERPFENGVNNPRLERNSA